MPSSLLEHNFPSEQDILSKTRMFIDGKPLDLPHVKDNMSDSPHKTNLLQSFEPVCIHSTIFDKPNLESGRRHKKMSQKMGPIPK
jgi:hypothetical protein